MLAGAGWIAYIHPAREFPAHLAVFDGNAQMIEENAQTKKWLLAAILNDFFF
ncbi:MAG: hypothetical protein KF852_16005 [Saprospiraceae bacterium]|nr:hypothetical protein [Saprospiraceae bacterium]